MSATESGAVDSFFWLDGGLKWVIVAGATALCLIVIVIIIVLCIRGPYQTATEKSPCFNEDRYCSGPYAGLVAVPISCTNDGLGPTIVGAPPPYSLTFTEQIQPSPLASERASSPFIFGLSSFAAPPVLSPPSAPTGSHSRPLSPRPQDGSYSEDEDEYSIGKIWFSAIYRTQEEKIEVEIVKARIVPVRDRNSTLGESFIKVYLLPDEQTFFQTKAKRRTMTPKFNEKFAFDLAPDEIRDRFLRLSAYVMDRRNVRNCLGHVIINLEDIDIDRGECLFRELQTMAQPSALGDINYSISYHPNNEKLRLTIIKCRHLKKLPTITGSEKPDIRVKVQLTCGRKLLEQKVTAGLTASPDPAFNEIMTFTVSQKQMTTISLVLTVVTSRHVTDGPDVDEVYGSSTVGPFMFAHGDELRHWQEMLAQPRTSITKWHILH